MCTRVSVIVSVFVCSLVACEIHAMDCHCDPKTLLAIELSQKTIAYTVTLYNVAVDVNSNAISKKQLYHAQIIQNFTVTYIIYSSC